MARASIHQLITMLADESQSVDVDFPQVREWLQELIQLRDQMSKIKAQYPSLAPQEQPFIQQMEAEALEAANKNMLERIEGLQRVLQSRDDKINELSSQFEASERAAAARERRVADLEKHNRNLATEVEKLRSVLVQREHILAERSEAKVAMQDRMKQLMDELQDARRMLGVRQESIYSMNTKIQSMEDQIKTLTDGNLALDAARVERHNKVCELEAQVLWLEDHRARVITDKMMLQHVLEDREAQIKTLTDQKQELQDELTFRRDITLGAAVSDYDALKQRHEELRAEFSEAAAITKSVADERDKLRHRLKMADVGRLTPLGRVFKEQAPFELTDSQVIMLVWLLEHTPNARQRTAYVCEGCGQPMVNRDGGQMANPCQCEPGVGRKTVGVF